MSNERSNHLAYSDEPIHPLAVILYILAGLEFIGGIVWCVKLWPDKYSLEAGYIYKAAAYSPSLYVLVGGILSGFLLIAVGEVLRYLKIIANRR